MMKISKIRGIWPLAAVFAMLLGGNAAASTPTPLATNIWIPAPNTSWQWQLSGLPVDQSVDAAMYDIDLFDNPTSTVASLHAQGRHVVCYLNAGAWEDWRPDAAQFPDSVKGNPLPNWPGERWLDIRQLTILEPLISSRMDLCQQKGFDAVEPDNIDGYSNDTGFIISYQDQIAYNTFLATAAHARGLSIGLKNDMSQASDLLSNFDWALNEECFYYAECNTLAPFTSAGKAVFNVEYNLDPSQFCATANQLGFNSLRKNLSLDAYRVPCRGDATPTPAPSQSPTATPTPFGTPAVTPTNCADPFTDLGGDVFYPAIHHLNCAGVVNGMDATHFRPTASATRAQFAKVLALGFGLSLATLPAQPTFSDVPASYYAHRYIEAGVNAGILSGYSASECQQAGATYPCFLPARQITRAELTKLVVIAAGYPLITPPTPSFADVPASYFAYSYIETAHSNGIINGSDATHFAPNLPIRRDEMCQIVYRATSI